MNNLKSDALDEAVQAHAERIETEILAAWRADYDYVHLYQSIGFDGESMFKTYILPSNSELPARPKGVTYQQTYVLKDVDLEDLK